MNFQCSHILPPIRVLVVNPLSTPAQLTIIKIMSGLVFGINQLIDLTLLVYSNERLEAEDLMLELHSCGFSCLNSIVVSSDLPIISDADVFCFITNFRNPNSVDFNDIDMDQFDVLYLIIKIANSLSKVLPTTEIVSDEIPKKKTVPEVKKPLKPIIMADGVVTMNILNYLTKDVVPSDVFFCPTPLPALAKNAIGEHLKAPSSIINDVFVWAANDEVFHIEVATPIVKHDTVAKKSNCDWDGMGKKLQDSFGLDHTQFNESWLKKDLIEKVEKLAANNPYGSIYRASAISKALQAVWKTRSNGVADGMKSYDNVGVISDGSLDTIKGSAYILPLVFSGDTWSVNKRFEESSHLQQELKRINNAVKKHKEKLIPYCKKFLEENVINQAFLQSKDSETAFSSSDHTGGPVMFKLGNR